MSDREGIAAALRGRTRWHLLAFGAGCAERFAPVCRLLAQPATAELYDTGLQQAWRAASGQDVRRDVQSTLRALAETPEAAESESLVPGFYAMWVLLGVFDNVLHAVTEEPEERARWASEQALEFTATLDHILEYPEEGPAVIDDTKDPKERGRLEAGEHAAQERTLQLLGEWQMPDQRLLDEIRHVSQQQAAILPRVLLEIARRMRWNDLRIELLPKPRSNRRQ